MAMEIIQGSVTGCDLGSLSSPLSPPSTLRWALDAVQPPLAVWWFPDGKLTMDKIQEIYKAGKKRRRVRTTG